MLALVAAAQVEEAKVERPCRSNRDCCSTTTVSFDRTNPNRTEDRLYSSRDNELRRSATSSDKDDASSSRRTMTSDGRRPRLRPVYFHYLTAELVHQDLEKKPTDVKRTSETISLTIRR